MGAVLRAPRNDRGGRGVGTRIYYAASDKNEAWEEIEAVSARCAAGHYLTRMRERNPYFACQFLYVYDGPCLVGQYTVDYDREGRWEVL